MSQFAFPICLLILQHAASESELASLQNIQFDEITTVGTTPVGWIKIYSCDADYIFPYDINTNLSSYAISIKFVPPYTRFHPKYAQYAITAQLCSNPIVALNNQKEVSFVVNPATGQIEDVLDLNDWIGTNIAKARLIGYCSVYDSWYRSHTYDFPDTTIIDSCSNTAFQIIPSLGACQWAENDDEAIEIYLGFDANKTTHCNSTSWREPPVLISTQTEPVFAKNNTKNAPAFLTSIEFDESSTYIEYDIGWKRIISCSNGTILLEDDYTIDEMEEMLPFVLSLRISPPAFTSEYDAFALETVPCSSAIYAMNHGKEVTWNIDTFDFRIQSNVSYNDWIGSNTAKQRLQTGTDIDCRRYLGLDYARDFPVIYSNCDHGLHIDINSGICEWDISNTTITQDMEIYFGFDANKDQKCIYDTDDINITHSDHYTLVRYKLNWFDAELFCQQQFGTTLAIITQDVELEEAINLRYTTGLQGDNLWIGLHKSLAYDDSHDTFWYWFGANNATNKWCDYAVYGCSYDTHWIMKSYYNDLDEMYISQCAAIEAHSDAFEAYNPYSCDRKYQFLCDKQNIVEGMLTDEQNCDLYIENEIDIEPQALRVEDVQIRDSNMISFSIQLDDDFECVAIEGCNILHVGAESRANLPSVFIAGNHLEIYFFDRNSYWRKNVIHNAVDILSDGNYHQIDLIFSILFREYKIDHISYYFEENLYIFLEHSGSLQPLYVSSPWTNSSVKGTIKNICIQSNGATQQSNNMLWIPVIYLYTSRILSFAYWDNTFFAYSPRFTGVLGEYVLGMYFSSEYIISASNYLDTTLTWSIMNFDYGSIQPVVEFKGYMMNMQTIQDEEMFYIIQSITNMDKDALFVFNLTSKSLERTTIIPSISNMSDGISMWGGGCIATDDDYLYIVFVGILLYDKANDSFIQSSVTSDDLVVADAGCAVTHDQESMFIFGGVALFNKLMYESGQIFEYDIIHDTLSLLEVTMKAKDVGVVTAVTAYHQIFVHANFNIYNIKKETLIFDVESKEFETYTVEDRLVEEFEAYTREDRIAYDPYSNTLMKIQNGSIDVLIMRHTKIDFTPTQSQMWRSDIQIDYNLFDYTLYDGLYKFLLQIQLTENTEYVLMIDAINDQCYVCDDDEWNIDCSRECHLPVEDDRIENMSIGITSINQNPHLFANSILNVQFLQCIFDIDMKVLANNYVTVEVTPQNMDVCASNPVPTYITSIYNDTVAIHHNVMVEIVDNIASCSICPVNGSIDCVLCSNGIQLQPDLALDVEQTYFIQLWSNTTDLFVFPDIIEVPFEETIFDNRVNESLSVLEIVSIIAACMVVVGAVAIFCVFYVKHKKLEEEVQRQKDNTQVISNPLVLYIGVAIYEQEEDIKAGIDVYCRDLDGVDKDAVNIKLLCSKFHYDLCPKFDEDPKLKWKQTEIIQFLKRSAEKAANGDYDSILVIFSSHGYEHSIITSDYQTINKDAIVRLFTMLYPQLCDIPRIFIFDCCDGERERTGVDDDSDDSDSEDDEQGKQTQDVGKNFKMSDIQRLRSAEAGAEEEAEEIKNSNYKLVTIHAANTGFQSKLNSIDGSYVIHAFVRKMLDDFASGNYNFFGEVMQDIQHKLHEDGKQYPTNVFHDNTRYLKFSANNAADSTNSAENMKSDNDENIDNDDNYQIMLGDGHNN